MNVPETHQIGDYQILGELGRGGMGVVYRARHVASERAVALKTVGNYSQSSAGGLESLRREIHALTQIRHPGVVRIVDHGVHHGVPWYAMDLLEGERLEDFCRRLWSPYRWAGVADDSMGLAMTDGIEGETRPVSSAPPPTRDGLPPAAAGQLKLVLQYMRRVCATLAFLHGEGFIVCDLTPRNILLVNGEPVLIDFGLASLHPGTGREAPESPHPFGTLPYMSPEQMRGELLDARSDLYSAGCVLYELLTGRTPFVGTHRMAFISQHLSTVPVAPSVLVSGIAEELDQLLRKLLEKELPNRVGHADEVASVLGLFAGETRRLPHFPPVRPYLYRPRLVGREPVMDQLRTIRDRTLRGKGAIALIGGESGIGKTRVAMEIARPELGVKLRVVTSEAATLAAQAQDGVANAPLQAVRPLLRAIADRCQAEGPATTDALLGERQAVLSRYEPLLAQVPSFVPMREEMPVSEHAGRQRLFRYLAETIARFALDQPVLWLLDDIGWADPLSLAFLRTLDETYFEELPLLLIGTYRSEEPNDDVLAMASRPFVTHILLERLAPSAVTSLVEDMLAVRDMPDDFLSVIAECGEGNPFFVSEYIRAAVGERLLSRSEHHRWQLQTQVGQISRSFGSLGLPRSLQALVDRRFGALTPAALQVLFAAATLGRDMDVELLRDVAGIETETLLHSLDELLRLQVLEEVQNRMRFAHDQLRTVAYARLAGDQRKNLHARAAACLEQRYRDRSDGNEIWSVLGHHFERADAPATAAHYLALAAKHAHSTHANAQAIQLYERAIALAETLAVQEPNVWQGPLMDHLEALGDIHLLTSQREPARVCYETVFEALSESEVVARARLCRKVGKTWESGHQHAQARQQYALGRTLLRDTDFKGDPGARDEWLQLYVEELWVCYWLNQVTEMDAITATIAPLMQAAGTAAQRSKFLHVQAMKNLRRDRYVVSQVTLELVHQTLVACRTHPMPVELPMAQFFYGMCLFLHGSVDTAEEELRKAVVLAERSGDIGHQARCLTYLTAIARSRGNVAEVRATAAQTLDLARRAASTEYVASALAHQSWASLRAGESEQALQLAESAVELWRQFPAVFPFKWWALLPLLEMALEKHDFTRARDWASELITPNQHHFSTSALEHLAKAVEGDADVHSDRLYHHLSHAVACANEQAA